MRERVPFGPEWSQSAACPRKHQGGKLGAAYPDSIEDIPEGCEWAVCCSFFNDFFRCFECESINFEEMRFWVWW